MRMERWLYTVPLRLRSLFRRRQVEQDLEEEFQYHVERKTDQYIAQGLDPEVARRNAIRDMDGIERRKEECRDARGMAFIDTLRQDLRYGVRMLRRNPSFAALAVLTIVLGIGANTAIFGLINAVLIRPLPYPEPDRLVHALWQFQNGTAESLSATECVFWDEHNRVFESSAAVGLFPFGLNLVTGDRTDYVKTLAVSRDFFRTLGVQPFIGRSFTVEEDRPKGPNAVILSYGLWQRRFASDPGVVGRDITLNGESYAVIGVMPKRFQFVIEYATVQDVEAWIPLRLVADPRDDGHNYGMIARLRSGVTLGQAQSDMARVLTEIREAVPGHVSASERGILLIPYQRWVTGDVRQPLLILFGAVGLVLLIAMVNVANLILTRAITRQSETAVRLALGATGARVLRQFLTENVLLAILGGCGALVATPWTMRALVGLAPESLPIVGEPQIDFRVLGFALLIAAAAGVAAGVAPAFGAWRLNLNESIRQGARAVGGHAGRRQMRSFLVGGEVALAVLLLTGAMLLILSLSALQGVNPGFNPQGVWTFHLSLPEQKFKTAAATWTFEQQTLARLESLPGVESAAVVSALPLELFGLNGTINVLGGDRETQVYVQLRTASRAYFKTMEIPILRGRGFQESDSASAPLVVVVNEAFARKCCANGEVLGRRVVLPEGWKSNLGREIVGVIGNTKEFGISAPAPPSLFFSAAQLDDSLVRAFFSSSSWAIRSRAPVAVSEVGHAIGQVDSTEAVADFSPMSKRVAESLAGNQFMASLMTAFAGLALLLAAIGLYGVLSYAVAERTHEIGVRMALGAEQRTVLKMVLAHGTTVTLAGTAIGLAAALALDSLLANLLFEVRPTDPLSFALTLATIASVSAAASYIPARRATKVDPMRALRCE